MQDLWHFINDPANTYAKHTQQFLTICGFALFWAILISLPLGLIVARRPRIAFLVSNFTGLIRAVPTLAFFALVINWLGIGFKPTVVALIVLGIPPILLNTVAGLQGIDNAVRESARGMGMTFWQVLTRVEIPLALPVVMAGVRNSAVQIVATAPIAAIIGGGGYGDYIIAGINLLDRVQLLAGALPVALLALAIEWGLSGVEYLITPQGLRARTRQAEKEPVVSSADAPVAPLAS